MSKFLNSFIFSGLMILSSIVSSKLAAEGKTRDNYFPVFSLVTTPVFVSQDAAFSLRLEAGAKSNRVNGTIGFFADDNNRFKISAEILSQKLHFKFSHRDREYNEGARHWLHQFAIGGKYQYLFDCPSCVRGFELGLIYSNAPSKKLSPKPIEFGAPQGENPGLGEPQVDEATLFRRIAGATNWEISAGFPMCAFCSAELTPFISYQQTHYKREYQSSKRISGVGFGLNYNQRLFCGIDLNLKYKFTQAYNDLRVGLFWNKIYQCGALGLGIFVDQVYGKRELPSSTTTGIELSFGFGVCGCSKVSLVNAHDTDCCDPCYHSDLLDWVNEPAVYMPQVLAIRDRLWCFPPTTNSLPSAFTYNTPGIQVIDLNDFYNNSEETGEIHYEVSIPDELIPYVEVNEHDGLISIFVPEGTVVSGEVLILAVNKCGTDPRGFTISWDTRNP